MDRSSGHLGAKISQIAAGSPAAAAGLTIGDRIIAVNGQPLRDVIDFQLLATEDRLDVEFVRDDVVRSVSIGTDDRGSTGIYFEKSVFDKLKVCRNHCLFCFIDQLPAGCRDALYVKDDDFRLSFLYGNFVTLTNLGQEDIERIVEQRLSPLYVSLHSMDQQVRARLLRPPAIDRTLVNLRELRAGEIEIHIQIVVCPGINDGDDLNRTVRSLREDFPGIASVGIVPVGLTGHRQGLAALRGFEPAEAAVLLAQLKTWQAEFVREDGYRWVYAADEFYLMTGCALPPEAEYDDFPQLENGIGLTRQFMDELSEETVDLEPRARTGRPIEVITGKLGAKMFEEIRAQIETATGSELRVIEADNRWLGGDVSVSALLAGVDIIDAINAAGPAGPVLMPANCLNADELFLDDLTLGDAQTATGVEIVAVPPTGHGLMTTVLKAGSNCA